MINDIICICLKLAQLEQVNNSFANTKIYILKAKYNERKESIWKY